MWDYPRPPRLEEFTGSITVELGGRTIASTTRAWRVLETSHPPTYYLPAAAFADGVLRRARRRLVVRMERAGNVLRLGQRSVA